MTLYNQITWELAPPGKVIEAAPGDFILCHRGGFASWAIRKGTKSDWSHAAWCLNKLHLVEALTKGVVLNPIEEYRDILYCHVHTNMEPLDAQQANTFIRSCIGQEYGWGTIAGIAIKYLTPGPWPQMVGNGTEICSGMVGQGLVRGWANFKKNPAALNPGELGDYAGVKLSDKDRKKYKHQRIKRV